MKPVLIVSWVLRIIAAVIMLQTLFFKFTGSPESVYIFSTLGIEPWGRIGSGIGELAASILLLWPGTISIGALLGTSIMSVALLAHLTLLGISVQGDHGYLFYLGITVFICCIILLVIHRTQLLKIIIYLNGSKKTALS